MGREKFEYDKEVHPLLAEKYARDGMIDVDIAASIGMGKSLFYKLQQRHKEFKEAIKRGKRPVNVAVENALLKRAEGYTAEETQTEVQYDESGKAYNTKVKTIKKHIPAEVGAIAFWLKNREPEKWSDRKEVNVTMEQPLFPDTSNDGE